jgi:hypothetical protein
MTVQRSEYRSASALLRMKFLCFLPLWLALSAVCYSNDEICKKPNTICYLTATHDLPAGKVIEKLDLETRAVPFFGPVIPMEYKNCIVGDSNAVGHTVTHPIRRHQLIKRTDISLPSGIIQVQ